MMKVVGLILHVLVSILSFEFGMEFSTNREGIIEIFNEVIKLLDTISIEAINLISRIQRPTKLNSKRTHFTKNLVSLLTKEDSKSDCEGFIAVATVGLLFSPFPLVLIALQFDTDFV